MDEQEVLGPPSWRGRRVGFLGLPGQLEQFADLIGCDRKGRCRACRLAAAKGCIVLRVRKEAEETRRLRLQKSKPPVGSRKPPIRRSNAAVIYGQSQPVVRVKARSSNPAKISLKKALELAVALVDEVARSEQTRYLLLTWWGEIVSFSGNAFGAKTVADLTPTVINGWLRALTKDQKEPSKRTRATRRFAVRKLFQALRMAGVNCGDPTVDIEMHGIERPVALRALTDDEVLRMRAPEGFNMTGRRAAIWALLEEGATTREVGKITLGAIAVEAGTVALPGCRSSVPRVIQLGCWQDLGSWTSEVLAARVIYRRERGAADSDLLLYTGSKGEEVAQVAIGQELDRMWRKVGLDTDPAVRPRSIRAWLGWKVMKQTGRIDEVARVLGMRSLDQTAELLLWRWQETQAAS